MLLRMRSRLTVLGLIAPKIKTGLALLGLFLIIVVIAEFAARGVLWIDDNFEDAPTLIPANPFSHVAAYELVDYDPVQLIKESIQSGDRHAYKPYKVWSRRPFTGTLVNVDEEGNRFTLHNSGREDALKVWMFGGSTTWGWGAPDGQTIASHLARIFNEEWGVDAHVTNFGEGAFVSTQEVVALIRALHKGGRPGLVLFYDGINDSSVNSQWPEEHGAHSQLATIANRVERKGSALGRNAVDEPEIRPWLRSLGLYRVAQFAKRKLGLESTDLGQIPDPDAAPGVPTDTLEQLTQLALSVWLENYKLTTALANEYGFNHVFTWQPTLWTEWKPLDPSEERLLPGIWKDFHSNRALSTIVATSKAIRQNVQGTNGYEHVYDITHVFQNVVEPVFVDETHLSGPGNRIVAERIFEIFKQELCDRPPGSISRLTKAQLEQSCT